MYRATITFFCLVFILALSVFTRAQTSFCPPNLDFEQGGLGFWEYDTGSCCPITVAMSGVIGGRHTLTFGTTTDPYGNFPVVAPGGGQYSFKLGNDNTARQAERARYYIQVPPAPGKYIFVYRYAVVFQDPKHQFADQPRFEVRAYDSATNDMLSCNHHLYVANSTIPGFLPASSSSNIYYKPWTTATLDLTSYSGKTVAIDFTSSDCGLGGHFGYGYVDMNCGLFQIYATQCNNAADAILVGPPGYKSYQWMDAGFTKVLGTTQTLTVPTPQVPTIFAVIVTPYAGFGCTDTFYTEYNVVYDNITALAPDVKYCSGGAAQLNVGASNTNGPFQYTWWPSTYLSCTTCPNPKASPPGQMVYYVAIEDTYGCRDTEDVVVTVFPKPIAYAGPDTAACVGDEVVLVGNGGGTYKWSPAVNLSAVNVSAPKALVQAKITYYLVVTNSSNCTDTDDVIVTPYPEAVAFAGNDSLVCKGAIVHLHSSTGTSYSWFPGRGLSDSTVNDPYATIHDSVTYYLKVTNELGCMGMDTITITTFPPDPLMAGYDTSICAGDTVQLFASGGQLYSWLSDHEISDNRSPAPWVWPSEEGVFSVHITDTVCNREDTLKVKIAMTPAKQLRVVATPILCGEERVGQLTAYGGKGYTWSPPYGLENIHANITKASPERSTLYTLTGINAYGCKDTASALLEVSGDNSIFAPNAFTPNGDGINDCFHLIVIGNINSFHLHIYNRWGQEVFTTNNYNDCWDGTANGEKLDLGTYYYFYQASSPLCGNMMRKGDIQLVR